jgi:TM2 domain-containing membrane protein YozV
MEAALIVELVSFGFFGWLIHKYRQKKLSAVAAWFVVSLVGILQMCLASTFEVLGYLIIVGGILMFFSFLMILVVGASESRERWAEEDRLFKKARDALKPFE